MRLYEELGRRWIEACLWLVVFTLPFSKTAVEIGIWTALGTRILIKPALKPHGRVPKTLMGLYGFFLLAVFVSVFQADPEHATTVWRGFFKWFKYIGLFLLSVEAFEDERCAIRIRNVFLISLAFTVLNGFYQMLHGTDLIRHYTADVPGRGIRMRSSFGSPNGLAGYLVVGLPIAFTSWVSQNKWSWKSALSAALVGCAGVAFISTLSRAAFLALFASLTVFALFRKKAVWIGPAVALSAALFLASPTLRDNFITSLHPNDITVGERLRYWNATLQMIGDRPWTGHGVNSFFYTFARYAPAGETLRGYAHNCYMQMAAEIGVVGLVVFLIPLFWILSHALVTKRTGTSTDALTIGMTAMLFLSFVDTHLYSLQQATLFWIFWGMLTAQTLNTYSLPGSRSLSGG